MFDAKLRRYIDPSLNRIARDVAQAGISADHVTLAGAPSAIAIAAISPTSAPASVT